MKSRKSVAEKHLFASDHFGLENYQKNIPTRALLYFSFKHILINLTSFMNAYLFFPMLVTRAVDLTLHDFIFTITFKQLLTQHCTFHVKFRSLIPVRSANYVIDLHTNKGKALRADNYCFTFCISLRFIILKKDRYSVSHELCAL
jgi:hypothetical protein